MGRAPLTAAMKASYFSELAREGRLPRAFADSYGTTPDKFFIAAPELRKKFGGRSEEIPWEAVAVYTYLTERIGVGLKQLMAGARKWDLNLLDRNDIVSLTERAAKATAIPLIEEMEQDALERILG